MICTLIVTNNTSYLVEAARSSIGDLYIVYDSIDPIDIDVKHIAIRCNALNPAVAKNVGVERILKENKYNYIQFLDSDDCLSPNLSTAILTAPKDYDLYFTDYYINNIDYEYTSNQLLSSVTSLSKQSNIFKIKNPCIKTSVFKKAKFDAEFRCFEFVDLINRIGPRMCFHIPEFLQTIKMHSNSYENLIDGDTKSNTIKVINGRIHGKI